MASFPDATDPTATDRHAPGAHASFADAAPTDREGEGRHEADPAPAGYGHPPMEHRFRKGRSGNPRGRPRRKRGGVPRSNTLDFAQQPANRLLMKEAYRMVDMSEGDRTERLPAIQAVYRSIAQAARAGHRPAQAMWVQLVQQIETAERETRAAYFEQAILYKSKWEEVIQRCRAEGRPEPAPVPHPDDIIIDLHAPRVIVDGPMTEFQQAQKAAIDRIMRTIKRRNLVQDLASLRAEDYHYAKTPEERAKWLSRRELLVRAFDRLNAALPAEYRKPLPDRWMDEAAVRYTRMTGKSVTLDP